MLVYHKNKIIDEEEVKLNVSSPGIQFGYGFFTTAKYVNNQFQFIELHLKRLQKSVAEFGIKAEEIKIHNVLNNIVEMNNFTEARVKIIVYLDADNVGKYLIIPQRLVINKSPKIVVAKISHRGAHFLYRHKSLNYFENIYFKKSIEEKEVDEILFFNPNQMVLETISSNIFFIKENIVYTPKEGLPILNGVVRQVICNCKKIEIKEEYILLEDIRNFESCFLTNSIQGIVPVKKLILEDDIINFDTSKIDLLPDEIKNI